MLASLNSQLLMVKPGDWEPIGNRNPLPRIETSPIWPDRGHQSVGDMLANAHRLSEGERIWRAVREAAGDVVASQEPVAASTPPAPSATDWETVYGWSPSEIAGCTKSLWNLPLAWEELPG